MQFHTSDCSAGDGSSAHEAKFRGYSEVAENAIHPVFHKLVGTPVEVLLLNPEDLGRRGQTLETLLKQLLREGVQLFYRQQTGLGRSLLLNELLYVVDVLPADQEDCRAL